jgi:hypothetical protein
MEGKVFVQESNNTEHKTPWSVPTERNSTANSMLWKELPTKYTSWLKYTPAAKDYQQIERNFGSQARTRNNNISLQYPNLLLINRELALLYQLPATNKGRRNTVGWKKSSRPRSSDAHSQLLFIHEDIKTRNSDTHSQLLSVHEDFKNKTLRRYSQLLFEHLECELSWPRSFSG